MAHPAASSSQPAQIPALDSSHQHGVATTTTITDKAPKEKKGQGKPVNTSEFPLEVRWIFLNKNLDQLIKKTDELCVYILASTKTRIL